LAPIFAFSDDFFNKNGVYQLFFRQSKLIDCTIWYHSNGAVVWCSRLKSQNGAVVDGTIVVFYGTSDRLDAEWKTGPNFEVLSDCWLKVLGQRL
jgi:hypothetical protein